MRSEPLDARSDDLEVHNTMLCILLQNTNPKSVVEQGLGHPRGAWIPRPLLLLKAISFSCLNYL
ncbi:hypothetical protein RHMOL_Rhmol10G0032100 [Rhododendron molle]|uniref:Uncharacterized protein n=1 Tax=Rhododendron molle TaxID=49168 RepID=A0ACC0LYZ5_RHOML|nr:hypothetical protein RHMOL_Rhmol10G0032100 [Rhododendron molle]